LCQRRFLHRDIRIGSQSEPALPPQDGERVTLRPDAVVGGIQLGAQARLGHRGGDQVGRQCEVRGFELKARRFLCCSQRFNLPPGAPDAGVDAVQLFDSWAGSVPAPLFDAVVIGPTAQIVKRIRSRYQAAPIIGFPRGAASHLEDYAARTGVDAVGLDHMTSLDFAAEAVPSRIALQGNLDPALLLAGGAPMEREVRRIWTAMAHRPFVFNLGPGVAQETPPENVARLVSLVRGIKL
jgi:hypothetical protein